MSPKTTKKVTTTKKQPPAPQRLEAEPIPEDGIPAGYITTYHPKQGAMMVKQPGSAQAAGEKE